MAEFVIKPGDTFVIEGLLEDPDTGEPIALSPNGITATSAVKTAAGRWLGMIVTERDQEADPGAYDITPVDTSGWPTGKHQFDVQYDRAGNRWSSETYFITVVEDITP